MANICILTDSTAQFTDLVFPGHELVNVVPLRIRLNGQVYTDGKEIKTSSLPASCRNGEPRALPPTVEDFRQAFISLSRKYNEIVTILISSHLNATVQNAIEASEGTRGPAAIYVIDSQTTAVGLGLLVQAAAEAARQGLTGTRISRLVRGWLPRVYTVFCVQSLTYLYQAGHLDPAQAVVGEMLGVMPFFILENGRLVPIQKVRSPRHLVDILHEFLTEFTHLKHIALIQGAPPFETEARNLRERLNGDFAKVSFSEHTVSPALGAILGPRSLGLVAMEDYTEEE